MSIKRAPVAQPTARKFRCAIYTRVSTDHGLDQEFNSLDAQREASEAYIKSQAHEGWTCLRQAYDDGGYSGGSMERPALQRLLDDVRAKKLDVIVVYKVDRLTRSLADFAKLVELFDSHQVSFISVTQSFNTTSSMGRLTLNVLLSFAQFEREVTGERIRDKFTAARKKGMWMGGNVPLGYRLGDRKLLVEPKGAETVRNIFDLYLEIKSLPKLAMKLVELGIASKERSVRGKVIGGQPVRTGALSHLLSNRLYIGEVRHHDQHYPGEHEPIVDRAVFDAVQAALASRLNRTATSTHKSGSPLQGLLFDSKGNRMVPVHANKAGVRYRYYQSWVLNHGQKEKAGVVSRIPAQEIEQAVSKALSAVVGSLGSEERTEWKLGPQLKLIERIDVVEGELRIALKPDAFESSQSDLNSLVVPWAKSPHRRKKEIMGATGETPSHRPMRSEARSRLLRGVAQGQLWLDELIDYNDRNVGDIATRHGLSEKSVRSTMMLALLAPDIIEAALDGKLFRGITVTQMTDLPSDWGEQKLALGLS